MVMLLGVTDIVILLYRTTHPRIYLRITKTVKALATIKPIYKEKSPHGYKRIVDTNIGTSIHWNN